MNQILAQQLDQGKLFPILHLRPRYEAMHIFNILQQYNKYYYLISRPHSNCGKCYNNLLCRSTLIAHYS